MQHTAHHALITRLNMWRVFFTTEAGIVPIGAPDTKVGTVPIGAPEPEYGVDQLVALAIMTRDLNIIELAELVNRMADNYTRKINLDEFDALMQHDAPMVPVHKVLVRVTLEELDTALAGA